jgi:hypothetical protein
MAAVSGGGAAAIMWLMASYGAGNLHPAERGFVELLLVGVALLIGALTGGLISRHGSQDHPVLFGVTAGAISGGVCGAAYSLVMGVSFVSTFGGAPVGFIDGLLVILAYPVFAALGALIGSVPGLILGACGAYLVTRTSSVARLTG